MIKLLKKHKSTIILSFVVIFLIGYQVYRITHLDLHYLGEEVSLHIAPSYISLLAIVPLSIILIILLPGLFIVSISFKLSIYNPKFDKLHLIYEELLSESFIKIFNRSKRYQVIRC
ncbi:MAG: hypothetical protein K9L64_06965 [Candidatus Izimaplasma sp.]|nr:hypothetical protein [Candidatus Izimaplasma bacterium]